MCRVGSEEVAENMEHCKEDIIEEEQDDVGIASIEDFLDRIEDPDESILDAFQDAFYIVKESLGIADAGDDATGSTEYKANKVLSEKWESDAGSVKPNQKANDGFSDCIYKGGVDALNYPLGQGTLT